MGFVKGKLPPFAWPEAIALAAFALLTALLVHFHQPWADEAQAWLIARDCTLTDIFCTRLHYEATPGLWHFLLWILARLHFSYEGMRAAAGILGILTAWFILRYAPFPRPAKLALPFVFGFVYQTGVIARSYSLVPLLAFALCLLISSHRDRPIPFALVAGLLANCATFCGAMSAGFVAVYLWRRRFATKALRPQHALAAVVLLLLWAGAIYTALPAPDITFYPAMKITVNPKVAGVLARLTGIPAPDEPTAKKMDAQYKRFRKPEDASTGLVVAARLVTAVSAAFFTVSSSNVLAAAFFIALILWLHRTSQFVDLLPFLMTLAACALLGFSAHHASVPLAGLVASLWISWERGDAVLGSSKLARTFQVIALLVIAEQIGWTVSAIRLGLREPFDGGTAAAAFVRSEVGSQRIAAFNFGSPAIEPYFEKPIFFNSQTSYWAWKYSVEPDARLAETLREKPPYIVVSEGFIGTTDALNQILLTVQPHSELYVPLAPYIASQGYRVTHRFCGVQPAHFGYSEQVCQTILQPRE